MSEKEKPTIAELEALLNEPNKKINIMPDGSIVAVGGDENAYDAYIKQQDATIAALREERDEARNMCDLYVDEFHRIEAITDNTEIKGLCQRAVFGIKQRIPIIEQRDRLEAENTALREEVERLKAENAQMKCNFAPILHFARQEQEKKGEPLTVIDSEGIPIENAVLRRDFKALRARLAVAEGKVEKVRKTINDPMVCEYQQMRNRLNEDIG